jgi:two-component system, NarL family, invasion response regulator UvrY
MMNSGKLSNNDPILTILLVEDHPEVRGALLEWLRGVFPDCLFLEAKTGEEALDQAQMHEPDIILMDIGLPGINGIEATRIIKKDLPMTQVLMLTVHEDVQYKKDADLAGAISYLPKRQMYSYLVPLLNRMVSLGKFAKAHL